MRKPINSLIHVDYYGDRSITPTDLLNSIEGSASLKECCGEFKIQEKQDE